MKYNKEQRERLKHYSRQLRKFGTKGEAVLWKYVLRARKTGYQFNRQFVIAPYIVDFISRKLKLIIEIDGSSHLAKSEQDAKRQKFLEEKGYKLLRFTEKEVLVSLYQVADAIFYHIEMIENTDK